MSKHEAQQLAYDLVLETVRSGQVYSTTGNDPKKAVLDRGMYLAELHRILTAYFEMLPGSGGPPQS